MRMKGSWNDQNHNNIWKPELTSQVKYLVLHISEVFVEIDYVLMYCRHNLK
jgi:hypothetical protein